MKYRFLLLLSLFINLSDIGFSQEYSIINNDSLLLYYLNQPNLSANSGEDVTILQNIEVLRINAGSTNVDADNWISSTIETCYRLNTTNALDLGQITIPYNKNLKENQFQLITITIDKGKLIKNKIERSDLLVEKIQNNVKVFKLNVPNLYQNSILYFKYNRQEDISYFLGTGQQYYWGVENEYTTLESIFEIQVPRKTKIALRVNNIAFDTIKNPGLFVTTPNAFFHIEKILPDAKYSYSKYLLKCNNIEPAVTEENVVHPWYYDKNVIFTFHTDFYRDTAKNLKEMTKVGLFDAISPQTIDEDSLNKQLVEPLLSSIKNSKDSLGIAKAIYAFVRDSIKNTSPERFQYFLSESDYNALLKNRLAYPLNKNKLLTFLLRRFGFPACNTILSTSSLLSENDCRYQKINYLLTAVSINSSFYLLDAGFKYLPFGTILPQCYNGFAWIITNEGVGINLNAASIEDKNVISCSLTPNKSADSFDMQMDQRLGKYSGAILRAEMGHDTADLKEDVENNKRALLKDNLIFKDYKVGNKDSIDEALKITYALEYIVEKAGDFVYINPFFSKIASENPFKNVKRHYPIEYSMPPNKKYLFKMKLPEGYTLEENIEDKRISFNDNLFTYTQSAIYDNTSKTISMNVSFIAKTNIIPVKDYTEFRSFIEQIITEQNKKIVLKKE